MVTSEAHDAPLRSHLLVGTVRHRRRRHTNYDFTHRVWYLAVDLDEIEQVGSRLRLLSINRRNLLELRDSDHLHPGHQGLRAAVREHISALGADPDGLRVTLIAYPRVAGYVFNPVSFYLCHDRRADHDDVTGLRLVIAEVHNTHGDRELYDFTPDRPRSPDDADGARPPVFHGRQQKRMYVSPFIEAAAHYDLRVREDAAQLAISIHEQEPGGATLFAGLRLRRLPLTERKMLGLLARDPVVPLKTSALIGLHAFRLWLRGVPWIRYQGTP